MRIDLIAPPYSGHLHPVLAIAQQLAAQHDVHVISTPAAQTRIRACGLTAASVLDAHADRVLLSIANPAHAVGHNPWRLRRQLHSALVLMAPLGEALQQRFAERQPDLAIVDFTLPIAGLAAQTMGIAWWTSMPSPCVIETEDGPPAYFGGLLPATTPLQQIWHAVARRLTRVFKRSLHRCYRCQMRACGLPGIYRRDCSEAVYPPHCILAFGVPSFDLAQRWPAAVRFVGPQLYTPPSAVTAPDFVAGRRHVLVTLVTHLQWAQAAHGWRIVRAGAAVPRGDLSFQRWRHRRAAAASAGQLSPTCRRWIMRSTCSATRWWCTTAVPAFCMPAWPQDCRRLSTRWITTSSTTLRACKWQALPGGYAI